MNLGKALTITGWMSPQELTFLAKTAAKSSNILEVGSFQGRSTRAMVDNSIAKITCVDPWDGKTQLYNGVMLSNGTNEDYSRFFMNLYEFINNRVIPVRKRFDQFTSDERFDFLFIDAIHEYDALLSDIKQGLPLLTPDAVIAGHDYCPSWPGVIQAVDEIFPKRKLEDTIWYMEL
jgi:predicted O-methyltransferase YrrM